MQRGALNRGGCMWSLMDLNVLRFLSTLYCSSCGGSIGSKFRLTLEYVSCDSCGTLILTNLPFEFLNHWNINSYMQNRTAPKRNKENSTNKG